MCDITFLCMSDGINIHAHSGLLKNVSKLIKDTQGYLLTQPKLVITLEGVLSNTVHILLQFLYIGKIQLKETDADNLHALCQMLKIDFGEEMVSVLNKDNMEIYPQPGSKAEGLKPRPPIFPSHLRSPTYPAPEMQAIPKIPVHTQPPPPQNSLKMTIKTGPGPTIVNKSPHAPKSQFLPQKYAVMPKKRKVETPNSPNITPYFPTNPKHFDDAMFDRRASSSSMSSNNSVVRDTNLYCYCQKPTSKDLIGCDHCPQWYHPTCLNLSEDTVKAILNAPTWKCPECEKKSAVAKKAKLAQQGPLFLPIPNGAKFCEIKTTRLESWGTDEYEAKGFIPLDRTTWVSFDPTESFTPEPSAQDMEIPPLPEDLADDLPETKAEQPRSQIVQNSFPSHDAKPDRIRPSEVLNKKGVQSPTVKKAVEKPKDIVAVPAMEEIKIATAIIPPGPRTVGTTQINQSLPRPPPLTITPLPAVAAPNGPPLVVIKPAPQNPTPVPVRGRPRLNKEVVAPIPPVAVVEPTPVITEAPDIQPILSPTSQTAVIAGGKPRQRPLPPKPIVEPVTDKPRMSTSEMAIERMKNEMRVAAELKLIEEAARIRDMAEKRAKALANGSKNAGPASRRGRRPKYRPTGTAPIIMPKAVSEAVPEVNNTATAPEPTQVQAQPQPAHVPVDSQPVQLPVKPEPGQVPGKPQLAKLTVKPQPAKVAKPQPAPSTQQLKVKTPRGRRSSPNVNAQAAASASVNQNIIKNIKKEKIDEQLVKNIKKEKVTDHSMEEILSRDATELSKAKPTRNSRSFSNQNQHENEEIETKASPYPDENRPDEENNADSSKNESYDELFFCYICKSIYVSKKALAAHQKSAHSK